MNLKDVFSRVYRLIVDCQGEWGKIEEEHATLHTVRREFLFPMMACLLLTRFFCLWWNVPDMTEVENYLSYFLKGLGVTLAEVFVGFYLAYLFAMIAERVRYVAGIIPDAMEVFKLLLYSSSILWAIQMLTDLFSILFFLKVASVYVVFVLWTGIPIVQKRVQEEKRSVLAIVLFLLIYACPLLVEKILSKLMY